MRAPLYLLEQGSKLSCQSRLLVVTKQGQTLARLPLIQVSQVLVFGNVEITTPALKRLLDEGIEVVLLSQRGRFYGRLVGATGGNGGLRVAQILRSQDSTFALHLARHFVRAKLHNCRVLLQRYARRQGEPQVQAAVEGLERALDQVEHCRTINSLSGVEGRGTAVYFGAWKSLLKPPWHFHRRLRRPPPDPVNVLLSFGYTLLSQNILGAVLAVGLDPYVGFLHQLQYNRPSLALDLMEEFRPVVVDSVVLRCLNNGILQPEHFQPGEAHQRPVVLVDEGVKRFVREMEQRLEQEIQHPQTGERVTYRRLFLQQVYSLARALQAEGGGDDYTPHLIR
ncbi:CRISPR-associated endonuclease Cas1 [Litorilinea aerophila]|uniref:CRISPR-associated endonuclease Cas1 n=1 Tax=Litorilinea aerophila TaxID=1204385 RepID=A0A540VAB3_9CHLR|nr:CRISPR-associated endonuclease Cas1 [Litorilinea aerophila]MCC9078462.1 CRISPR-associated endonuclease Cas1 [Litorilinea aerophila]OUC05907.1 hypothetical protein RY27_24350 [Litorilinea aerophila]